MAVRTGFAIALKLALQRFESDVDPVSVPAVFLLVGCAKRAGQVIQHAQVVERMDFACDRQSDCPHARPCLRCSRQQRGLGSNLVQVFDDRERLRENAIAVNLERRHESLGIECEVILRALIAHSQMDKRAVLRGQALEIERNADAVRGGRAKIVVELHRLASRRASASLGH